VRCHIGSLHLGCVSERYAVSTHQDHRSFVLTSTQTKAKLVFEQFGLKAQEQDAMMFDNQRQARLDRDVAACRVRVGAQGLVAHPNRRG
jgi:hypothetical protein